MAEVSCMVNAELHIREHADSKKHQDIAFKILNCIFTRRRLIDEPPHEGYATNNLSSDELEPHFSKIFHFVSVNQPIHFVLPAFPGKSPNRHKTLSHLPDLAEQLALDELNTLCCEIQAIYPAGAHIHICSDGYVFSDLVKISDGFVKEYTDEISRYIESKYPESFSMFDLKDAFPQLNSLDVMRENLMALHGQPISVLKNDIKTEAEAASMYKGITRFLFEDYSGLAELSGTSKTQIQKSARSAAYGVIQRSNAWSVLLEKIYPTAVRLSIHPQIRISKKIGIKLVPTNDVWRTPWHSVAIKRDGKVFLDKRSNVDENKNYLVFRNGRPCYYTSLKNTNNTAERENVA